jgi:hypothetical protein
LNRTNSCPGGAGPKAFMGSSFRVS